MDNEKAPGVVLIRTSMDTADRHTNSPRSSFSYPFLLILLGSWKAIFSKGCKVLVRRFSMLIYGPIVQLLCLYIAFIYGLL